MNFLKRKLKPLASGFTTNTPNSNQGQSNRNLEDDLYDEYVVEAPPHPSDLIALGVDPSQIDVNDPDKLRELYRKAKEEGKDKQTNSILLAKQRQKEEIEEKKRTREEWKFFDSLTSRVEQAVRDSQKTLEQLKESSAVNKLTEPEYDLRQTADEVFKTTTTVKLEKGENDWIDFEDSSNSGGHNNPGPEQGENKADEDELDEFGCPKTVRDSARQEEVRNFIAEELLEDFGIDLRTEQQRKALELERQSKQLEGNKAKHKQEVKPDKDIKLAARPRPRPAGANLASSKQQVQQANGKDSEADVDPFDTSFLADDESLPAGTELAQLATTSVIKKEKPAKPFVDPFDTSYINF